MVALLEGGYNLAATAASTEAMLRGLMGMELDALAMPVQASAAALAVIAKVVRVHQLHWECLRKAAGYTEAMLDGVWPHREAGDLARLAGQRATATHQARLP